MESAMSQAVVDPAELRRFAHNLKRFSEDLQMSMAGVHGQMQTLGESWRDQEHARFVLEFEQTLQTLNRFLEAANLHIPFLVHKAERIEEYLQQR
jgi:uncharacterized protein YukE